MENGLLKIILLDCGNQNVARFTKFARINADKTAFDYSELGYLILMKLRYLIFSITLVAIEAHADSSTVDAAIGGAIGGGVGAAIGNEIGGRDGAIIGGALGGAAGTAINTDDKHRRSAPPAEVRYKHAPPSEGYPSKERREDRKERLKRDQEIAREDRKHYEEMEREERKHREEMRRERSKAREEYYREMSKK